MPKMTLEWDFNDDNGVFEREDAMRCMKSLDLCLSVMDMLEYMKSSLNAMEMQMEETDVNGSRIFNKYAQVDMAYNSQEALINQFHSILEDRGIDLDELVS